MRGMFRPGDADGFLAAVHDKLARVGVEEVLHLRMDTRGISVELGGVAFERYVGLVNDHLVTRGGREWHFRDTVKFKGRSLPMALYTVAPSDDERI